MPEFEAKLPKVHKEGCRLEFDSGSLVLLDDRRGNCYCIEKEDFIGLILALIRETPDIKCPEEILADGDEIQQLLCEIQMILERQQALQSKRKEGAADAES